ncbi:glycosyltransferase [Candidatus Pelagibacter communis]|uniref:Glycosyl transferase family protein n=1 Tax=Pelagibacter ubique (strain HTCC1002) TaxID=314261 RepID=Q1V1W8_PELU1|nr:glycosyltransferase [Candidatus Pelagibacter ubique]EAS84760.1 glycosyl transferase family protein [Candidatus Pelagibacter ubique HTCC1002]
MRICVIVPSFFPAVFYGGTIFSIHESLKLFSNKKLEIFVSTTSANGRTRLKVKKNIFLKLKQNYFVKYYFDEIINRFSLSFLFGIWSDVKKSNIVYVQDIFSIFAILGFVASRIYNKKCIIAPRGSLSEYSLKSRFYWLKMIWIFIFLKIMNKNFFWHVTSEFEKKDIFKLNLNGKIFIIPNFIKFDLKKIKKLKSLNSLSLNNTKKVLKIGTLTRLDKKKGLLNLIRAFSKLKTKKDVHLFICGEDHGLKQEIKKEIKIWSLNKKVTILKPLYGIKKYQFLKMLDVFCLPSKNENFGNVYLESLRVGTPIIASKFTPWKNVIKFKCGLITNNMIDNIALNIDKFIQNRNKFKKSNCEKLANLYNEVVIKNLYLKMFYELNK